MKASDFIGPVCGCGECIQAGVADESQRRDPRTGIWLHGYALRRWLDARAVFRQRARAAVGGEGRHGKGFEKLVKP
jgi:hypothetical protein